MDEIMRYCFFSGMGQERKSTPSPPMQLPKKLNQNFYIAGWKTVPHAYIHSALFHCLLRFDTFYLACYRFQQAVIKFTERMLH